MKFLDATGLSFFWTKIKDTFQVKLVSGTNIKTINGNSVLGSGNISISSGSAEVSGTITVDAINVGEDTDDSDYGVTITPDNGVYVQEPGENNVYTNIKHGYIELSGSNTTDSVDKYIVAYGLSNPTDGATVFCVDGSTFDIQPIDDATINAFS